MLITIAYGLLRACLCALVVVVLAAIGLQRRCNRRAEKANHDAEQERIRREQSEKTRQAFEAHHHRLLITRHDDQAQIAAGLDATRKRMGAGCKGGMGR